MPCNTKIPMRQLLRCKTQPKWDLNMFFVVDRSHLRLPHVGTIFPFNNLYTKRMKPKHLFTPAKKMLNNVPTASSSQRKLPWKSLTSLNPKL